MREGISDLYIYVAVTSSYPRERGVTLLLVKVNDQSFSNRPEGWSLHYDTSFLAAENLFSSRVTILFFIDFKGEAYKKIEEKLQVKKKIIRNLF